ncbi:MAG TPA: c-type cytochrome [Candidatus Baltobacteraceae bacterium]|nr:c-type cytochrome [Candidatus Baltobacteraceae bacterium]
MIALLALAGTFALAPAVAHASPAPVAAGAAPAAVVASASRATARIVASDMTPQPQTPPRVAVPNVPGARHGHVDTMKVGAELYAEHCISCHGATLHGTGDGPSLIGAGTAAADFMLSTGRMPIEVPYTEEQPGPPSFPPEQIAALVAYVGTHGAGNGPPIPRVAPSGDIVRGRAIFEENCQQCHGAVGTGAVAGFGWIAPPLPIATNVQVAEAVRFGPGIMPRFDEHAISPRDLDALVAYVQTLHHPQDPGGWSVEASGPVGEGLIAFVVGLGVTILVMRLVGETVKQEQKSEL